MLFLRWLLVGPALAYWGHGANFQKNKTWGLREWWKRRFLTQTDWWFAYTEETVNVLLRAGYPLGQITCLNNAIDNTPFQNDLNQVYEHSLDVIRQKLCIEDANNVGLYCGSLYPEKRLDFLQETEEDFFSAFQVLGQKIYQDIYGATLGDPCDNKFELPQRLLERYNSKKSVTSLSNEPNI